MAASTVTTNDYAAYPVRASGLLADGSAVHIVVRTSTYPLRTIRLMHSSDRSTWTEKVNYDPGSTHKFSAPSTDPISMTIDESDNVHVVFASTGATTGGALTEICYVKFTKGGGYTWSAGSTEVVATLSGRSLQYYGLDIDCMVASTNLLAVSYPTFDGTNSAEYVAIRRTTSPAWVETQVDTRSGLNNFSATSVARGSSTKLGVLFCRKQGTATPYVKVFTVTASSGALSATFTSSISVMNDTQGYGTLYTTGTDEWSLVGFAQSPSYNSPIFPVAARFNSTAWVINPTLASSSVTGITNPSVSGSFFLDNGSVSRGVLLMYPYPQNTGNVTALVINFDATPVTFGPAFTLETLLPNGTNASNSGNNRNIGLNKFDVLVSAPTNYKSIGKAALAAPTAVGPTGTIGTDTPTLSATLTGDGFRVKADWYIALDSGFTTGQRVVYAPDSDFRTSGVVTRVLPDASALTAGTWYIKAASVDELGVFTFGGTTSFVVYHPPSAINLTPTGGLAVSYGAGNITFDWDFSSASSSQSQTAYQVIVEDATTSAQLYDTGKITSTTSSAVIAISASYKNIPLRWKVRVYDVGDTVGSYSDYAVFLLGDGPSVNITAPASASVQTTPTPTVTWTPTFTGGRTQGQYQVNFYSGSSVIYSSGWITGTTTTFNPPSPGLTNNGSWVVEVKVRDSAGLEGSDTNAFTTAWTAPATVVTRSVDTTTYDTLGYATVTWTTTGIVDAESVGWRVYRRLLGENDWTLLGTSTTVGTTLTMQDRFVGANVAYEYDVRQIANRFGTIVEGASNPVGVTIVGSHYWLLHATDSFYDVQLSLVVSDNITDENESQEIKLLGRGRKMEYGTRWGYSGTLTCQIRDQGGVTAREIVQRIKTLKDQRTELYLRNPFGDVWLVDVADIGFDRMAGVSTREFGTITIPYKELSL